MRALQSPPSRLLAEGREQTRSSGPAASPCSPPALCSPPARDDGLEDEQWDMEAMVLPTIAGQLEEEEEEEEEAATRVKRG